MAQRTGLTRGVSLILIEFHFLFWRRIVAVSNPSRIPIIFDTGDQLINVVISCGIVLGLVAIGVYLIMLTKRRFQSPIQYETVGADLEGLRSALKIGSIDKEEYNRAVQALEAKANREDRETVEDLESVFIEESVKAARSHAQGQGKEG